MPLRITIGAHSDKGQKPGNQDFHGALIPDEPALSLKGIAIAIADGISSSEVSHIASESAVKSFLTDYYCTPDAWSVKTSARRVIAAANSWLYAQTRASQYAYDRDKGYVCTLSAMVIKAATAHLFHIGDCRIYRPAGHSLEQLTDDHRVIISSQQSYLGRALGVNPEVEIDYQAIRIERGDIFVLATDGVHEHVGKRFVANVLKENSHDLDQAARIIVAEALAQGSADNLTIQIVRIDELGAGDAAEIPVQAEQLPPAPVLDARMIFEGYRIVREIHASSRSHIYLAVDVETELAVALKVPSIDLRGDPAYLKRFLMEDWIARRIDNPHVLKAFPSTRRRDHLYVVTEFVEGQTLAQWMIDHPKADLDAVRDIIEQIARGLQALHRKEVLHQDLRPANIMIDRTGTVKIIDFGSVRVSGVVEADPAADHDSILGTQQYTAPEYFLGEGGSEWSDQFSLGVIAYQMLTGRLPYGAQMARARTRAQFRKVLYHPASGDDQTVPLWIDGALRRAVHPVAAKRYESLSEFVFDLRHPNPAYIGGGRTPLIERNPLLFWKATTALLAIAVIILLAARHGGW
ncbi:MULTISPECIES: bifunctional protein-serine/threonine kinase/phosphatase [unclassified Bradyrhizobium]|uniref:bifunctional protein-serine/threonine kinase/phosphatase n=1 Tax=unclassified Bradyrhizobium TaxID=2631580 RepID=UPI002916BB26|nr:MULTISPECIES: bifunctional protein-serine/threonine kinase/phosphatase [unclassified Bradyrhizobium]